jgi:hypothetical protein
MTPDRCEICHGENGGVPGNENIVRGRIMCDYCHARFMALQKMMENAEELGLYDDADKS